MLFVFRAMKFLLLLSILLALVVCFQATEARVRSPTTSLTFTPSIQYTKLMMLQKSSRHYHYTYSKTTGIISIQIKLIWLGTTDRIKYAYCSSYREREQKVLFHIKSTPKETLVFMKRVAWCTQIVFTDIDTVYRQ